MSWKRICFWYWADDPVAGLPVPEPPVVWPPITGQPPVVWPPIQPPTQPPSVWPTPPERPGVWPNPPFPPSVWPKPPSFPVLPIDPDWDIPVGGPPPFGNWVPVDPGFGKPPIFGFVPVDPGFGIPEGPSTGNPGHWLPVDPSYGVPVGGCPEAEPKHKWVWIPEIGPDFGKRLKKDT